MKQKRRDKRCSRVTGALIPSRFFRTIVSTRLENVFCSFKILQDFFLSRFRYNAWNLFFFLGTYAEARDRQEMGGIISESAPAFIDARKNGPTGRPKRQVTAGNSRPSPSCSTIPEKRPRQEDGNSDGVNAKRARQATPHAVPTMSFSSPSGNGKSSASKTVQPVPLKSAQPVPSVSTPSVKGTSHAVKTTATASSSQSATKKIVAGTPQKALPTSNVQRSLRNTFSSSSSPNVSSSKPSSSTPKTLNQRALQGSKMGVISSKSFPLPYYGMHLHNSHS